MNKGFLSKVKDFFVGLAILIVIGLVWLFLLFIWALLPEGSFVEEIAGALFLLYSIAILVIFSIMSFKGGGLGWIAGLIIAGILCYFLAHLWKGLLVLLLFAGIGIAIWIGKWKKRKEAVAWELEDQLTATLPAAWELKELKEQLGRGVITQEEYEQKKKKLLEKSEA